MPIHLAQRAPWLIILSGCLIAMIGFGPRASMGFFMPPMVNELGWGRDTFAFALALQNLLWGIGQPIAGAIADRYGTYRVLAAGALMYGIGLVGMQIFTTPLGLNITAGALVGFGLAGCSFNLVLGAFAKLLPEHKRPLAFGLGTAAGSFGQFLYAPIGVAMISSFGWQQTLFIWGLTFAAVLPLALMIATSASPPKPGGEELTIKSMFLRAFSHRSYNYLVAGFFVCGFHIAFITVHLPAYLLDKGLSAATGGKVLAAIGLFNIIGSISAGYLTGKMPKRLLLAGIYGVRSLAILAFILLPVTELSAILFGASIGLLWLSTVPPTSALVGVMFGTRFLSMLYGFVFLSHQLGAFIGVWLGGYVFEKIGSYMPVWWIGIGLGLFAALIHLPIRERVWEPALKGS